jgi:hypothetical protein
MVLMLSPLVCIRHCLAYQHQCSKRLAHAHLISKDTTAAFVRLFTLFGARDNVEVSGILLLAVPSLQKRDRIVLLLPSNHLPLPQPVLLSDISGFALCHEVQSFCLVSVTS